MANAIEIIIRAQDYASEVFERLRNTGVEAGERLTDSLSEVSEEARQMGDRVDDAMEEVERAAQEAEDSIEKLAETAEEATKDMKEAAEEQKEALQSVTEQIGIASAALTTFAQVQKDVNARMDKLAYLTGMQDSAVSELVQSISDANFGLEETLEVLERGRKEGLKSEEQLRKYAESWKTVQKATGLGLDELLEFSPILERANAGFAENTDAMDAFGWVMQNTTSSIPEFMDAIAGAMIDIGDAEIRLNEMAAALKLVEEKYGVTGPEAISVFQTKVGEAAALVEEQTGQAGFTMEAFMEMIGATTEELNRYASQVAGSSHVMEELANIQDKNATLFDKIMAKVADFNAQHQGAIQTMGTFGTIMSGLTPVILLASNAQAIYTTITTAATGATTAFGTAITFLTGPVGLVILAITALIGVGYLLIKNWESVKEFGIMVWEGIVSAAQTAWELLKQGAEIAFKVIFWQWILLYNGFKEGIKFIMDVFPQAWDKIKEGASIAFQSVKNIWSGIGNFFKGLWDGIIAGLKAPFNFFIDTVNKMIGAVNNIQIKVPDWVPGLGGKQFGFNIPNIPRLHTGGIFNAPIGQREGLALLKDGEMVLDPMVSRKEINNQSNNERPQIIRIELDGRVLAEVVGKHTQDEIILRGGW
ncbi:hypothetical protein SAMN04489735_100261 [Aneurinibacillus thermoaerophilus]|uniref:Phage tail tape measure protein, TP901 family, core region n=1 Tax=Aneurinibacillus thermoaerophilus TaxID=143495 RepID=A0A1G7WQC0_ANETH|nr:hypothetical protein [Aneurinibacillus thermoaerophilus]SDG74132.1 hypothetical protein SAMN04489735_100261 [Aneurinibacillus thermoaerophilus]